MWAESKEIRYTCRFTHANICDHIPFSYSPSHPHSSVVIVVAAVVLVYDFDTRVTPFYVSQ